MVQPGPGEGPVAGVEAGRQEAGLGVTVGQERHGVALLQTPQLGL